MSILTTFGNGDIQPTNDVEKAFTILLMLAAHILFAIFIGRIINCFYCTTLMLEKYKTKTRNLAIYLKNNKVSKYTINKVMLYLKRLWQASNGEQMPSAINFLNDATRRELLFYVYGYLLKKSIVFSDTQDIFLKHLCQHLKRTFYFRGDYIVQHGDFDKSMYFIHKGKVRNLNIHYFVHKHKTYKMIYCSVSNT